MTDRPTPIRASDAIHRTSTALVLELADGRTVELTAHVQTARDDGLRGMDPVDPTPGHPNAQTQMGFQAGPARLILRDLQAEDDAPIGLVPFTNEERHRLRVKDTPDDWRLMDRDEVDQRMTVPLGYDGPCYEHESVEAWIVTRKRPLLPRDEGGATTAYAVELESGDPSGGIWTDRELMTPDEDQARQWTRDAMGDYDHAP